uniref:Uncharacterized protein n=1 Tax=Polysiphonia infestans TaxID=2006978 RepID=A0A1Z1MEQ7_9FLOR|nr:hypothetical protein [Polysiphonia infestans]ARW64315.1 hypothetical protein [Polysiphonia infestans]
MQYYRNTILSLNYLNSNFNDLFSLATHIYSAYTL